MVIKFFMYQAHYRSILDFSSEALEASERGFDRMMDANKLLDNLPTSNKSTVNIEDWRKSCYDAMNDDFNSPILIAHLFEGVKYINAINEELETITKEDLDLLKTTMRDFLFDVLGLQEISAETATDDDKLSATIELLIELRNQARTNKDFETSDRIRDELAKRGIQLKDGKEDTTFTVH